MNNPLSVCIVWTSEAPKAAAGCGIQLELISPVANTFYISNEPKMPEIKVKAAVGDWVAGPKPGSVALQPWANDKNQDLSFAWNVEVNFTGDAKIPHSVRKGHRNPGPITTKYKAPAKSTKGGTYTLAFDQIRGGDLLMTVSAVVNGQKLSATTRGLWIGGTNPNTSALSAALNGYDLLKRMARQESSLCQFLGQPGLTGRYPFFSQDNLGGVGLLQITNPSPSEDEIWNWRENVKAAIRLYQEKAKTARTYVKLCVESDEFRALVKRYNDDARAGQQPLRITLAGFDTIPRDWLEEDAIRGFNGYGGIDSLGQERQVHEFEVPVDDGKLVMSDIDEKTLTGIVRWRRTPVRRRYKHDHGKDVPIGDPHYVENVKKQASF